MYAAAELAGGGMKGASSAPVRDARGLTSRALGPAMRLMLTLAVVRSRGPAAPGSRQAIQTLWDLGERYHPEQAWLAASWLRNERTLDELERHAPREGLAPGLLAAFGLPPRRAQDLHTAPVFAQE